MPKLKKNCKHKVLKQDQDHAALAICEKCVHKFEEDNLFSLIESGLYEVYVIYVRKPTTTDQDLKELLDFREQYKC